MTRSPQKPVTLNFDLQSSMRSSFGMYNLEKTITIFAFIDETLPLQLAAGANLS